MDLTPRETKLIGARVAITASLLSLVTIPVARYCPWPIVAGWGAVLLFVLVGSLANFAELTRD